MRALFNDINGLASACADRGGAQELDCGHGERQPVMRENAFVAGCVWARGTPDMTSHLK